MFSQEFTWFFCFVDVVRWLRWQCAFCSGVRDSGDHGCPVKVMLNEGACFGDGLFCSRVDLHSCVFLSSPSLGCSTCIFSLRFELPGLYLFFEYFRNSSLLVYIFTMAVINQPLITTPPEQRQPEPSTQDVMFFLPTTHTFVHSILISPTTVSSYGVKDRAPGGLYHR